jgi:hypothetical protein
MTMTADELRRMIDFLESEVRMSPTGARELTFAVPSEQALLAEGFEPDWVSQLIGAPWLEKMVQDVLETAEFCDPSDSPEQVLRFARDVVGEYIRKRFKP